MHAAETQTYRESNIGMIKYKQHTGRDMCLCLDINNVQG